MLTAFLVSGDANFYMDRTALTVGGFTQPCVAKSLIQLPASVEKGLTQRFLWIIPKPSFAKFDTLELVDERFSVYLGGCFQNFNKIILIAINMHFIVDQLASVWRASDNDVMTLAIPEDCEEFREYYDALQEKISQLSVRDELLSGMLTSIIWCCSFHMEFICIQLYICQHRYVE